MAEFYLGDGRARAVDRQGGDVFDFPREAAQGMHLAEMNLGDGDDSSVVFQGGVLQEPRVLVLGGLIPVEEVRQACKGPEPAKNNRILFRGQQGLGVWKLAVGQSLEEWHVEGKVAGGTGGYFTTVGGKIVDPAVGAGALELGDMSEVVLHRRLLGGGFGGMGKGGCIPGAGEWTCSNCGKTVCWSTRYSCYRCGVPRYFDAGGFGQGNFGGGQGKGGMVRKKGSEFQGQGGVGAGKSGMRIVGPCGRDQSWGRQGGAGAWCWRWRWWEQGEV